MATLPGEDVVRSGIADLKAGVETIESLLVQIGSPRLRRLGVEVSAKTTDNPEHRLYAILAEDDQDTAHSRYNALIRLLVSYERALECAS